MREVMVVGSGFGSSAALRVAQILAEQGRNDLRVILVDESLPETPRADEGADEKAQVLTVSRGQADERMARLDRKFDEKFFGFSGDEIVEFRPRFTMADLMVAPEWTYDSGYQTREDVRRMRQQSRQTENRRQQSLQARARRRY